MHSILSRVNAIFSYSITVLAVMVLCNFVSTYFIKAGDVNVNLNVTEITLHRHKYFGSDFGAVKFNIDADLSSLFNWNTKVVFVYIVAEYSNQKNTQNSVVIWDRIIERAEDAKFKFDNEMAEYLLLDHGKELRGAEVKFSIKWDISPVAGMLHGTYLEEFTISHHPNIIGTPSHTILLPESYAK